MEGQESAEEQALNAELDSRRRQVSQYVEYLTGQIAELENTIVRIEGALDFRDDAAKRNMGHDPDNRAYAEQMEMEVGILQCSMEMHIAKLMAVRARLSEI